MGFQVSSDLLSYSLGWSDSALLKLMAYKRMRNESLTQKIKCVVLDAQRCFKRERVVKDVQ